MNRSHVCALLLVCLVCMQPMQPVRAEDTAGRRFQPDEAILPLDTVAGVTTEAGGDKTAEPGEDEDSPGVGTHADGAVFKLHAVKLDHTEDRQPVVKMMLTISETSLVTVALTGLSREREREILVPGEVPWGKDAALGRRKQLPGEKGEMILWEGFSRPDTVLLEIPLPPEFGGKPGLAAALTGAAIKARQRHYRLKPVRIIGGMGRGECQFFLPKGGFVDSDGNCFVADSGNDRVQYFDRHWKCRGMFGEFGWSVEEESRFAGGQFNNPLSVCVERYVYVVDSDNYRVCRYDREGNFIDSFGEEGSGEGQFLEMGGIAKDFDNNMYVADTGNDRVQKFDSAGNFRMQIGFFGWGDGQLNAPTDVEIGADNDIIVLDSGNGRVQVFNKYGSFLRVMSSKGRRPGQLYEPHGLDVVPGVGVLVADTGNDRVQLFSLQGGCLVTAGRRGAETGEFKEPWDVAIGPDGAQAIVMETGNHRLQILHLDEQVAVDVKPLVSGE